MEIDKIRELTGHALDTLDDAIYALDHDPQTQSDEHTRMANMHLHAARALIEAGQRELGEVK